MPVLTEQIEIRTGSTEAVHDLTAGCQRFLAGASGSGDGLLNVWVPHATAGLAVIETGASSDTDLLAVLRELLPADDRWRHGTARPDTVATTYCRRSSRRHCASR